MPTKRSYGLLALGSLASYASAAPIRLPSSRSESISFMASSSMSTMSSSTSLSDFATPSTSASATLIPRAPSMHGHHDPITIITQHGHHGQRNHYGHHSRTASTHGHHEPIAGMTPYDQHGRHGHHEPTTMTTQHGHRTQDGHARRHAHIPSSTQHHSATAASAALASSFTQSLVSGSSKTVDPYAVRDVLSDAHTAVNFADEAAVRSSMAKLRPMLVQLYNAYSDALTNALAAGMDPTLVLPLDHAREKTVGNYELMHKDIEGAKPDLADFLLRLQDVEGYVGWMQQSIETIERWRATITKGKA